MTEKDLLRFTTTGSVDDGKSTLIGRLLYETKCVPLDQYDAIKKTSQKRGSGSVDLALLLDGLAAEREQGITIDVAYRYFETQKRKFIIADTPGHEQYTRNMVTGASTADLAIVLIDARNGVLIQSKRHGFLNSLLQIPKMLIAVNKMDLVGYSQEAFNQIVADYTDFAGKLDIDDITFIPVSALKGDNVTKKSEKMDWYKGPTLLELLEKTYVTANRNLIDFRFPVQNVIRPNLNFRGFAGKITSGSIKVGEEIIALPSQKQSKVKEIVTYDGNLEEAFSPMSVVLTLENEIDISRGDMIVRKNNLPSVGNIFDAIICWMDDTKVLNPKTAYFLKQTTNNTTAFVEEVYHKIDVNTLHRVKAPKVGLNEIAKIKVKTTAPLFFDSYKENKGTGSFILIDPLTYNTVAGGIIKKIRNTDVIEKPAYIPSEKEIGIVQKYTNLDPSMIQKMLIELNL